MLTKTLLYSIAALVIAQAVKVALEAAGTPAAKALAGFLGRMGRRAVSGVVRMLAALLGAMATALAYVLEVGAVGIGNIIGSWQAAKEHHRAAKAMKGILK